MNGAAFFLAVNFLVALCFSLVFAVVSTRSRSRTAALWFAAGFGVASLSAVCELLVGYSGVAKPWAIGAFATVLGGMILLWIGIGNMYRQRLRWQVALAFFALSLTLCFAIYDLPRGTFLQAFSYQTPFALAILAASVTVWSADRRLLIDRVLACLMAVTGLHFFLKAALAGWVGAGHTAADYIHTNYALISQSLTAVLMVAVGLTLLAVLVLEIMADERSASESDALSGLANRRGFERRVAAAMVPARQEGHAIILCDLDHFKKINDTYGHHGGDMVIRSFAQLLRSSMPASAIVSRLGGEEFAVFLPGASAEMALMQASALRNAAMTMVVPGLPSAARVTASFGVAALESQEHLDELLRRADAALYAAKRAGRNRVQPAGEPVAASRASHLRPIK